MHQHETIFSLNNRMLRLQGQLIEVFKYLNRLNNVNPIGIFDYNFNDRTQNDRKKLIVKRLNASVVQHFFPINITTTINIGML